MFVAVLLKKYWKFSENCFTFYKLKTAKVLIILFYSSLLRGWTYISNYIWYGATKVYSSSQKQQKATPNKQK